MDETEDEVALKLLTSPIEPVIVEWSDEIEEDNVLAHACVFNRLSVIEEVNSLTLGANRSAKSPREA